MENQNKIIDYITEEDLIFFKFDMPFEQVNKSFNVINTSESNLNTIIIILDIVNFKNDQVTYYFLRQKIKQLLIDFILDINTIHIIFKIDSNNQIVTFNLKNENELTSFFNYWDKMESNNNNSNNINNLMELTIDKMKQIINNNSLLFLFLCNKDYIVINELINYEIKEWQLMYQEMINKMKEQCKFYLIQLKMGVEINVINYNIKKKNENIQFIKIDNNIISNIKELKNYFKFTHFSSLWLKDTFNEKYYSITINEKGEVCVIINKNEININQLSVVIQQYSLKEYSITSFEAKEIPLNEQNLSYFLIYSEFQLVQLNNIIKDIINYCYKEVNKDKINELLNQVLIISKQLAKIYFKAGNLNKLNLDFIRDKLWEIKQLNDNIKKMLMSLVNEEKVKSNELMEWYISTNKTINKLIKEIQEYNINQEVTTLMNNNIIFNLQKQNKLISEKYKNNQYKNNIIILNSVIDISNIKDNNNLESVVYNNNNNNDLIGISLKIVKNKYNNNNNKYIISYISPYLISINETINILENNKNKSKLIVKDQSKYQINLILPIYFNNQIKQKEYINEYQQINQYFNNNKEDIELQLKTIPFLILSNYINKIINNNNKENQLIYKIIFNTCQFIFINCYQQNIQNQLKYQINLCINESLNIIDKNISNYLIFLIQLLFSKYNSVITQKELKFTINKIYNFIIEENIRYSLNQNQFNLKYFNDILGIFNINPLIIDDMFNKWKERYELKNQIKLFNDKGVINWESVNNININKQEEYNIDNFPTYKFNINNFQLTIPMLNFIKDCQQQYENYFNNINQLIQFILSFDNNNNNNNNNVNNHNKLTMTIWLNQYTKLEQFIIFYQCYKLRNQNYQDKFTLQNNYTLLTTIISKDKTNNKSIQYITNIIETYINQKLNNKLKQYLNKIQDRKSYLLATQFSITNDLSQAFDILKYFIKYRSVKSFNYIIQQMQLDIQYQYEIQLRINKLKLLIFGEYLNQSWVNGRGGKIWYPSNKNIKRFCYPLIYLDKKLKIEVNVLEIKKLFEFKKELMNRLFN